MLGGVCARYTCTTCYVHVEGYPQGPEGQGVHVYLHLHKPVNTTSGIL